MTKAALIVWVSSTAVLAVAPGVSGAASRPRYGGTLRVEVQEGLVSLEPTDASHSGAVRRMLDDLVFEPLITLDDAGRLRPALALEWRQDAAGRRWEFTLRRGIAFSDGTECTAPAVAESLARLGAAVANGGGAVSFRAVPDLFAQLARTPVARRNAADSSWLGTGAFKVDAFQPDVRLSLVANDAHWGGRPYLDRIEIALRRPLREQWTDFELGRTDSIELAPEDTRKAAQRQARVLSSAPVDLMALAFTHTPAVADAHLREAVVRSVDRAAIREVLLQRQGEVAGALLPQWLSGYAFLFPTVPDLNAARTLAEQAHAAAPLLLSYDRNDALAHAVADRVAVNARDAGIAIHTAPAAASVDLRMMRLEVASPDPSLALADFAVGLEMPVPPASDATEDAWRAESVLLEGWRIVPLVHVPRLWAVSPRIENWRLSRLGVPHLADAWIGPPPPPPTADRDRTTRP